MDMAHTRAGAGPAMNPVVEQLLARARRLGADRRNTNYAGGNASAKGLSLIHI